MDYEFLMYHAGIKFDKEEEYIRAAKTDPNFTYDDIFGKHLNLTLDPKELDQKIIDSYHEKVEHLKSLWDVCPKYTPTEVMKDITNSEQKYLLMSFFEPKDIVGDLDAELIDRQTLKKTKTKTVVKGKKNMSKQDFKDINLNDVKEETYTYDDTYELFKVDKDVLGTNKDVYYVKCNDTSTGRVYYLYVQEHTDAIEAIASTMQKEDGNFLTKEEYLEIVSET